MRDPSSRSRLATAVPLSGSARPRDRRTPPVFLLSDGAGYITGDCLVVDGGEWLRNGGEFSYATVTIATISAYVPRMRGRRLS